MRQREPHLSTVADFEAFLRDRGLDPSAMTITQAGTLCPPGESPSVESLVEALPLLVGEGQEIQVVAPLGSGGMGDVMIARQRSLGRQVAVKRAQMSDAEGRTVLAEARVAGSLEHPNIVPVYGLARADDGAPVIVMKKIEGNPWSKLLHDRPDLQHDQVDHIRTLIKVCDAIAFAHSRGVLHCDLKPANVMIGGFGETYVLDWGIAAALPGKGPAGIRQADDAMSVAGTPHYLPPEVARMEGRLTEATDVYLLGGLLCVILTGEPPHQGKGTTDQLLSAARGDIPTFPDDAPEELVDLCRRALANDPVDRPSSAKAFQDALTEHLEHLGARKLIRYARKKLETLKALAVAPDADQDAVRRAFIESHFGYTTALREWPASVEAQAGRHSSLMAMVRYEQAAGRAGSASLLLGELGDVPADIVARQRELESEQATVAERLKDLQHRVAEGDARFGTSLRGLLALSLSLLWVGSQLALRNLPIVGLPPLDDMIAGLIGQVGQLVFAAGVVYRFRERLLTHQGSRVTVIQIMSTLVLMLVGWLMGWAFGASVAVIIAYTHLIMGMGAMAIAVRIKEFWPGAALLAAAGPLVALFPEHAYAINGAAVLLAFGVYVLFSPYIEARSTTPDGLTIRPDRKA